MRLLGITALLLLLGGPLQAEEAIHASGGAVTEVADIAAPHFRCLIRGLEAEGYRISFMGGYRSHGSVPHSLHPRGLALDINQIARNRVTRRLPANATSIAAGCGLIHGAVWHHPDAGHFQLGGYEPRRRHYLTPKVWASNTRVWPSFSLFSSPSP